MSIADLIRSMAAAGAPVDAIVMAVEALEARDNAIAEQRAKAAERKRRQRERERDEGVTVTGQSQDADGTAPLSPSPLLSPHTPLTTPHPHTPENITTRARKADDFPCPDGVDLTDWQALKANRKAKRAPLTAGAHRAIIRKLDGWARSGWPPGPIVANAAERGWTTVFETDEMKAPRNGTNRTASPRTDNRSGFAKALDDFLDHDPVAASQPACRADSRTMVDGDGDRDGPVASVITLRPDSVRIDHSDIAGRAAHAGYG